MSKNNVHPWGNNPGVMFQQDTEPKIKYFSRAIL